VRELPELDLVQVAAGLPIFQHILRSSLDEIRTELDVHFWAPGEILFSQGEKAKYLYIILNGDVAISAHDALDPAYEADLVTRRTGELVGEQAFLGDGIRTATAKCTTGGRGLKIAVPGVEQLLANSVFCRELAKVLSQKLADATLSRALHIRNERLLFGEFRAQVSPEVAQALLKRNGDFGAPRTSRAVVLFSDIRGFTQASASMVPVELAGELTRYLDHVVEVVHRYGGMVDKFIGDAVMAVWGDFLEQKEATASRAVQCAQELVATAGKFSIGGKPLSVGVGINTGEVFVGNVGGEGKRQFTVLGAAVNLASRLEAESKSVGGPIVVSEAAYAELSQEVQRGFRRDVRPIRGVGDQVVYVGPINEEEAVDGMES
jgi:class 3 adenylate cyclase